MTQKAKTQEAIRELETLPEELLVEVLDFVRFLKARHARGDALLSEAVLARDWNTPEEDEAWQDLQHARGYAQHPIEADEFSDFYAEQDLSEV